MRSPPSLLGGVSALSATTLASGTPDPRLFRPMFISRQHATVCRTRCQGVPLSYLYTRHPRRRRHARVGFRSPCHQRTCPDRQTRCIRPTVISRCESEPARPRQQCILEDRSTCQEGMVTDKGTGKSFHDVSRRTRLMSAQTLSLTGRAGLLQLLAGDPSTIHYSDKFQLGGPLSVRAFGHAGMGGHEGCKFACAGSAGHTHPCVPSDIRRW